jgi:hypothetical protein
MALAAVDTLVIRVEALVPLDRHPRMVNSSTAWSMSSTGKLRIVNDAGVWSGLG